MKSRVIVPVESSASQVIGGAAIATVALATHVLEELLQQR
jgi:hypothetical protein